MPNSGSPSAPRALDMALVRARLSAHPPPPPLPPQPTVGSPDGALPARTRAAVALVLRTGAEGPELLLIRRAEHPRDPWSGHMAFPGGREEPGDRDLLETAARETLEEVSLDLRESAVLLGQLDPLPALARGRRVGLTIVPFVFELVAEVALAHNHEVAETVWAPLRPLFAGARETTYAYELSGQRVELPAHDVDGRIVWGLTHRMLENLFTLLR